MQNDRDRRCIKALRDTGRRACVVAQRRAVGRAEPDQPLAHRPHSHRESRRELCPGPARSGPRRCGQRSVPDRERSGHIESCRTLDRLERQTLRQRQWLQGIAPQVGRRAYPCPTGAMASPDKGPGKSITSAKPWAFVAQIRHVTRRRARASNRSPGLASGPKTGARVGLRRRRPVPRPARQVPPGFQAHGPAHRPHRRATAARGLPAWRHGS